MHNKHNNGSAYHQYREVLNGISKGESDIKVEHMEDAIFDDYMHGKVSSMQYDILMSLIQNIKLVV